QLTGTLLSLRGARRGLRARVQRSANTDCELRIGDEPDDGELLPGVDDPSDQRTVDADDRHADRDAGLSALVDLKGGREVSRIRSDDARVHPLYVVETAEAQQLLQVLVLLDRLLRGAFVALELLDLAFERAVLGLDVAGIGDTVQPVADRTGNAGDRR